MSLTDSRRTNLKLSIIIPAFNEEKLLGAALAAVKAASASFHGRGWETEVIVCDNNSTDRTAEIARTGGALVVFESVNQIARARNRGAAVATGDWMIFVDADSEPSAGLFADVARAIEGGRCLGGGVMIRMTTDRRVALLFNALWNRLSRWKRWMAGSFIFVEAHAFRALEGFNEALFAGEEIDLSERLKQHAAMQQRKVLILKQHPLVTSGRKLELYTGWELFRFFLAASLARKRVLYTRESCHPWYDGRR